MIEDYRPELPKSTQSRNVTPRWLSRYPPPGRRGRSVRSGRPTRGRSRGCSLGVDLLLDAREIVRPKRHGKSDECEEDESQEGTVHAGGLSVRVWVFGLAGSGAPNIRYYVRGTDPSGNERDRSLGERDCLRRFRRLAVTKYPAFERRRVVAVGRAGASGRVVRQALLRPSIEHLPLTDRGRRQRFRRVSPLPITEPSSLLLRRNRPSRPEHGELSDRAEDGPTTTSELPHQPVPGDR